MKNPFKEFLYFSMGDRRAIVALGCVAVFAIGVLMVVDRPSPQPSPSMERVTGVESGPDGLSIMEEMSAGQRGSLGTFDSNTVDSLTLIGLGVKAWKVRNFLHYRAAGKVFRSAEEMGKTYGWTAEDVERVREYVRVGKEYENGKRLFGETEKRQPGWEGRNEKYGKDGKRWDDWKSNKFHTLTKVDVNTADTAMLRRIPGVGAKISEVIVRYREKLGGFHSVEQLREIKMVSPELLEWMEVSSPNVQKIPVNEASFQALNRHPYISYEQTKALRQYIRLYGRVKDEQALLETGIFTKEEL
ncbi:MAG: helix-hairpin-helix domain-containing protein, partial [Bacteroidaceae bacterium]|nr:helix-hairpin-helix domain-containing protein [Bacteroidaceae bacterium]